MKMKQLAAAGLAVTVGMMPGAIPAPAYADGGDALVGGIIGGIIGGAIVNESQKKKRTTTVVRKSTSSGMTTAQREANREVQVALNYFGYPVGTPDGVLGRNSRSAISDYQMTLGYPATGQLTEYERTLLVGSYHRGVAGGAMTMQQAAANPMGMRGLLLTWRDEAAGLPAQGQMAVVPAMPAAPAAPVTEAAMPEAEPAEEPAPAATGLPTFLGGAVTEASLASQCNRVGLTASAAGGYTTVATMTDPAAALGEQFCLVRAFTIAEGEEMAARVPGATPEMIREQCAGFGPAMKAEVAALSLDAADKVLADTRAFALSTGMAPAQLSATAKICLSVGYAQDDMDVAVASSLLLAALGEGAYAELLGHHLSQGFGATRRPDLAFDWYDMALKAADVSGSVPFSPGQPDRMQLVRKAAYTIAGRADQAAAPETVPAALPSFAAPVPAEPAAADPAAPQQAAAADPAAPAAAAPTQASLTADQVDALPLAARLPFLLFRN
ncbi:peptidoglycan-binding domain-containing protein [Albidovulum sp.]|jgi:peptidoglycan hydrolase-like protein with peptidoglycan-binding domain|uniref:peptidoglycan-binding domain-containing protein n=2 Tax=Albidovulum sp. TaxID=1872424 RepID=UPI00304419B9